ncbi:hypothetical protein JOC74_003495 [Bacillus capparidis]|uniref:Uncharacterized protein n=1 Tax=Bacillus capparidis TaxID=1840411 RepID=A0ABS4D068_9BACI|nr:hypothetical protein [Bacillus capparidis]
MDCTNCGKNSLIQVPEFEKTYTVCLDYGEVLSIKFENLDKLKKYKNHKN